MNEVASTKVRYDILQPNFKFFSFGCKFHFLDAKYRTRLDKPMKFEIKDNYDDGYTLSDEYCGNKIRIGEIEIEKDFSGVASSFDCIYFYYHGIDKALCGKRKFIPKRFVVIQMK